MFVYLIKDSYNVFHQCSHSKAVQSTSAQVILNLFIDTLPVEPWEYTSIQVWRLIQINYMLFDPRISLINHKAVYKANI